jgi:hypothetical protein
MPDSGGGRFDQPLLERYRPQLVYDCQYDYRATAAETMVENHGNLLRGFDDEIIAVAGGTPALTLDLLTNYPPGREPHAGDDLCAAASRIADARRMEAQYGHCVYGRVKDAGGKRWLQYWLWLYDNPKNVRGVGRHEGDWELVQVGIDASGTPVRVTLSQHKGGQARDAKDVDHDAADGGWHPIVYVAPLSHACYFEARSHVYVLGIDHPYGDGQRLLPEVREFGDWADWPGRWGNSEWAVLRQGAGPPGPGRQTLKWHTPDRFDAEASGAGRGLMGWLVHQLGYVSAPPPPSIAAHRTPAGVQVEYELRRARHIYITLHRGPNIVRSRTIYAGKQQDVVRFPMGAVPDVIVAHASAFNRLRQRSDRVEAPVA